jgi:aryl-alcohol dehydrogenase
MKIQAAVTRASHAPMAIETLDLDDPRDGEVLVKVVAVGICHTDMAIRDKALPVPQPIVLGHEGAGIVEQAGAAVTKVKRGDHVVMTFNSCGKCPSCNEHASTYCHEFFGYNFSGTRPDGSIPLRKGNETIHGNFFGQSSFATYALCHERNVIKVPEDAPLEILGPLACGIQTGAGAVINALNVGMGQSLAVFGVGSVGLSAIMAARMVGAATIIAIDLVDERLQLAKELGATHTINADKENPVEGAMKITGSGVNFSFESAGVAPVVRQAVEALAPRGICGIVGAPPLGSETTLDLTHLMSAGRSVRGIVEGDSTPNVFIPHMIEMHRQGRFPFDRLIRKYSFNDINTAISDSEAGRAVKPVLLMDA